LRPSNAHFSMPGDIWGNFKKCCRMCPQSIWLDLHSYTARTTQKCASFCQIADADLAAVIGGDRVLSNKH
jgi:hypothetical protein